MRWLDARPHVLSAASARPASPWFRGLTARTVSVALVISLLLAGSATNAGARTTHAPQSGGTVIFGYTQEIDSFIPVLSPTSIMDDGAQVLLYRPLLWIGQNVSIDYSRSIATGIAVSNNNTVFTVTMRPDYKWSDGQPVTADDVAYCFNLIKTYGTKYGYYGIGGLPTAVKSFMVLSPTQFSITLNAPSNPTYFELNGLAQLRPLPAHAWKKYSISYLFNHQTDLNVLSVVDGPYKLTKFVLKQYARFDRNPMYSGHKSYLDTFIIQYFSSEQAVFAALRTGAIQIGNFGFTQYNAASQIANLKRYDWWWFGFSYIEINYRNPAISFMKDVKVRQALQLLINQPLMNKSLYYGGAYSAYSPVPYKPTTYLSPRAKETWNASHFDPAKANAMLDADGWKMVNGVRQKNGQKLAFTIGVSSEFNIGIRQAQIIQQEFNNAGVQVSLNVAPFSVILSELGGKGTNWDLISIGWIYYPNFYPLGDGLFGTNGGANFGAFSDPKLDATIKEAQTVPGLKGIYDYQDYASKVVPALWLDEAETVIKYQPKVQGIDDFFNPIWNFGPEYLWLQK
ncbi:MAG TPA: peptide ABC transporter substrate-binding protein [Chloroflexota bacterium]|nr:peptide ABC transporter substrate-binding protein [Chloroflexota bacterium]